MSTNPGSAKKIINVINEELVNLHMNDMLEVEVFFVSAVTSVCLPSSVNIIQCC